MSTLFEPALGRLAEADRADVVAAWAAVETQPEPVEERSLRALRDVTLRTTLEEALNASGRTLVRVGPGRWTSGYRDDVAERVIETGGDWLSKMDQAVLVVVLIYSVAIPRSHGVLTSDDWMSAHPTTPADLKEFNQLNRGDVQESLTRLQAAGLVRRVPTPKHLGITGSSYVPGPQFHRLTPAARSRLQDELILAAGPDSALAEAIRLRRADTHHREGEQ